MTVSGSPLSVGLTSLLSTSASFTMRFETASFYDETVTAGSPIYSVIFAGAMAAAITSTTPDSSQKFGDGFRPGFYYLQVTPSIVAKATSSFNLQAGCETLSTATTTTLFVSTFSTLVLDSVGKYGCAPLEFVQALNVPSGFSPLRSTPLTLHGPTFPPFRPRDFQIRGHRRTSQRFVALRLHREGPAPPHACYYGPWPHCLLPCFVALSVSPCPSLLSVHPVAWTLAQ